MRMCYLQEGAEEFGDIVAEAVSVGAFAPLGLAERFTFSEVILLEEAEFGGSVCVVDEYSYFEVEEE